MHVKIYLLTKGHNGMRGHDILTFNKKQDVAAASCNSNFVLPCVSWGSWGRRHCCRG